MKLAIPVKEKSVESDVDNRFARAAFIAMYDTEKSSASFYENHVSEAHGAGPKMVEFLAKEGIEVLIAPSVGKNALEALQMAGIKVFLSKNISAKANIDIILAGKGETLETSGPSHK